jgi:hypothetical protein
LTLTRTSPRLGGRELGQRPFGRVGRPDADPVAALQAERHQAGSEIVDPAAELAPAPADVLMAHHQRLAVAVGLDVRSKNAPIVSPISFWSDTPWS